MSLRTGASPRILNRGHSKQLIVNGKPFLMRAAELQNSSGTSAKYMQSIWPKLCAMNVNTVLTCVTWESIEPAEGVFDFSELDAIIHDARAVGLKLVLLWFGSFKNALSTYAPSWVKLNPARFPRAFVRDSEGHLKMADTLSTMSQCSIDADASAFAMLMRHVREIDEAHSTVVMVQVENEPGLLGDSRDRSDAANKRFSEGVPEELLQFFRDEWSTLHPDGRANLSQYWSPEREDAQTGWTSTFGTGDHTDELFMAWNCACYVEAVASAGRKEYDIPLYTNFWLNYASNSDSSLPVVAGGGGKPGDYPSGGAVSKVLDIWMHFAPSLDFIAPDIYLNDYHDTCETYCHKGQTLFIPEQRRDEYGARRVWQAVGTFRALGASPFGIDTLEPSTCAFTKHYKLLGQVAPIILEAQQEKDRTFGFFFDDPQEGDDQSAIVTRMGGFELRIERAFVFGKQGPGSGMIVLLDSADGRASFLIVGWGFQVSYKSLDHRSCFTGILKVEEKEVDENSGHLKTLRSLNGDETGSGSCVRMPNEAPDYGVFPISITIPAHTAIAECSIYSLIA